MSRKQPQRAERKPGPLMRASTGLGAGAPLIVRRLLPQPDGTTMIELGLDANRCPSPERKYFADVAAVEPTDDGWVRLMFAQRKLNRALRSLVILSMTPESVRQLMKSCDDFLPKIHEFLEKHQMPPVALGGIAEEPEQTVLMTANIVILGRAGREAMMDCYHASPLLAKRALENHPNADDELEPVVRIMLSPAMLASVLDKLAGLIQTLPPEATT